MLRTEWPERCARVEVPASAFAEFRKAIPANAIVVEVNALTDGADDTGEVEVFVSHPLLKKVEPGYLPPTTIPQFSMSICERRTPNTKTGGWESEPVPGSRSTRFLNWGDQHDRGADDMLTREGLAELRRDATYRSGMGERIEVNPAILLQMLDVCDAHAELAVQCVDCKGHMSPKNPDLTLLDLAARTCLCPRCKALRERVPKPNQPTRPGNFWHKCAWHGNKAEWHPVNVDAGHRGLTVYHIGSEEDYDVFDIDGEWGAEIIDPAQPAPTA